jgi:hypothetical protein
MKHITTGLDCPCNPKFYRPCDDCEVEEYRAARRADFDSEDDLPSALGCWKCERGLIELTRAEAEASDVALVIVHNDV